MKKHNLKEQLKALIKKDDDSLNFCYTYYWTNNKVRGMDDIAFFDEIKDHKDKGNNTHTQPSSKDANAILIKKSQYQAKTIAYLW